MDFNHLLEFSEDICQKLYAVFGSKYCCRILSNWWLGQLNYLGISLQVKDVLTLYFQWIIEFNF